MSHVTDVKLKIRDLDALEEAAALCGLVLSRDQKTYAWYGRFVGDSNDFGSFDPKTFGRSEHALRRADHKPGDYEIGVVKAKDGEGFEILYDKWGPGARLTALVEENANKLRREYAAAVALRNARKTVGRKGFVATREDLAGGRIRVVLRKR